MESYIIYPSESDPLYEGDYKFLIVSKTFDEKDALIIFADVKTRHSVLLYSWMKNNDLREAYTFGGGRMLVSMKERVKYLYLFGVSSDYNYSSKKLVEEIFEKSQLREVKYELDLPTYSTDGQLTSFRRVMA